jgi:hypothetical protein
MEGELGRGRGEAVRVSLRLIQILDAADRVALHILPYLVRESDGAEVKSISGPRRAG